MMIHAYAKDYVDWAQQILGEAVDFAVLTLDLEPDVFGYALVESSVAWQFACGNPRYVAGMNGCEFARAVLDDTNIPYQDADDAMYEDKSPEYWAGWALAYYQWYSGYSFKTILPVISLNTIIEMYPVFHEMDIMRFIEQMQVIIGTTRPTLPHVRRMLANQLLPRSLGRKRRPKNTSMHA